MYNHTSYLYYFLLSHTLIYIFIFCLEQSSREQLAIGAFAESLLVIPNTLSVNAAKDATDLVPKLRAYHHSSQIKTEHSQLKHYGLDLIEGMFLSKGPSILVGRSRRQEGSICLLTFSLLLLPMCTACWCAQTLVQSLCNCIPHRESFWVWFFLDTKWLGAWASYIFRHWKPIWKCNLPM